MSEYQYYQFLAVDPWMNGSRPKSARRPPGPGSQAEFHPAPGTTLRTSWRRWRARWGATASTPSPTS